MPKMDNREAERLINTYADMILRISYMYLGQTCDAEDICQNIFLKFIVKDLSFESSSHEKAWIIRATVNACKDHLRTGLWKRAVSLDEADEIPARNVHDSELLNLVMSLPANYRVSIYLHYYEGYTVGEIAAMLGKRENAVSAYLSRGRKKLKLLLDRSSVREVKRKGAMQYVR